MQCAMTNKYCGYKFMLLVTSVGFFSNIFLDDATWVDQVAGVGGLVKMLIVTMPISTNAIP